MTRHNHRPASDRREGSDDRQLCAQRLRALAQDALNLAAQTIRADQPMRDEMALYAVDQDEDRQRG